jgi:mono/diheme cytochrome c family protein
VLSSFPAGCTGTPVTSQGCTYVAPAPPPAPAPAIDGAALYAQKCASCHGPLATSSKRGRTAAVITASGMTMGLTVAEVQAVADALK